MNISLKDQLSIVAGYKTVFLDFENQIKFYYT